MPVRPMVDEVATMPARVQEQIVLSPCAVCSLQRNASQVTDAAMGACGTRFGFDPERTFIRGHYLWVDP